MSEPSKLKGALCAAALIASSAGLALADGADVIVGQVMSTAGGDTPGSAWKITGGPVNSPADSSLTGLVTAFSLGTTSCNIGDVPFEWYSSTNRHPVIAQNLFKVDNGRFIHVGQSWLKHGFTALQQNACNLGCQPSGTGSLLGVGCSDPYSASLNSGQTSAGPKSQVNAATGFFPYPVDYSGMPSGTTTSVHRRLQVPLSSYSPTAVWIAEAQYVAQDDAQNGNKNNNASYRRATMTATTNGEGQVTDLSLSLVDSTVRQIPAIYAWRDHGNGPNAPDNNVRIVPIDVPDDGRFILGARVFQTGVSTWRYEYAVQNLNSHRSGQYFRVPFAPGVNITNVGFHNVPYHSGEPHSNDPWTMSISGDEVVWSGPAYTGAAPVGNELTANALRWGTVYSFWFEADAGPGTFDGNVDMGLFRPGSASNVVLFTAPTPGGAIAGSPINDDCPQAIMVGNGTIFTSTAGATSAGPDACTFASSAAINQDIWFRYTALASGPVTVSLCGSDFDTKLAVYGDTCPTEPGTHLACNDDFACPIGGTLQSQVEFNGVEGQQYLIRVGGYLANFGGVSLNIIGPNTSGACCASNGTCTIVAASTACNGVFQGVDSTCTPGLCPAPPGDTCNSAHSIGDGVAKTGNTNDYTAVGWTNCGSSNGSRDVWYRYIPLVSGTISATTCQTGTLFDTVLSVHSACPVSATVTNTIQCNDDVSCSLSSPTGRASTVSWSGVAGTAYYIRVAGWQTNAGAYRLLVTGGQGVEAPSNDNCINRFGVGLGDIPFSTLGATTDGPAHDDCLSNGQTQITNDVWFYSPSGVDGTFTITVCGTAGYNPFVALYSQPSCPVNDARLLACNDDASGCGGGASTAQASAYVDANLGVMIRVGGFNGSTGNGVLNVAFVPTLGACCVGETCTMVGPSACGADGGTYLGNDVTCLPSSCSTPEPCPGDFNDDGIVDLADLLDFLGPWNANLGQAVTPGENGDLNADGIVDLADLLDFLADWNANLGQDCP
ncbi:MAG: hypothetical protein KF768_03190 [Phycisphaeraceae bacterium]|nr:hypothetical protein [Phycisphaeraceae bacterium]